MKFSAAVFLVLAKNFAHGGAADPRSLRGSKDGDSMDAVFTPPLCEEPGNKRASLLEKDIVDKTIEPGVFGDWKPWQVEEKGGFYACGARVRFQDFGEHKDDTSANALELTFCSLLDWRAQSEKKINDGLFGDWKKKKMCPYGSFINGAQVRFDDLGGHEDETTLNGLKIHCKNPMSGATQWVEVEKGLFGDWKSPTIVDDKYVKGARVRVQDFGVHKDDTAWNGLHFRFDNLHYGVSTKPVIGEWRTGESGPRVSTTVTQSMATTKSTSVSREESYGFSQSISAGFETSFFGFGGVEWEIEVGFEQAFTTERAVENTLELSVSREVSVSCPDNDSSSGNWFLWQWVMEQSSDYTGPGFEMTTNHVVCTAGYQKPPRCPLGYCADAECQTCSYEFCASHISN